MTLISYNGKDVRHWACTVLACAEGGDTEAKGMLSALWMSLFRSLSASRQQIAEKAVNTGEIVIDSIDPTYPTSKLDVIDPIINLVAKDTSTDTIRRLSRLNKEASSCTRKINESTTAFIERFILPAQAYLNITNADHTSAESQNLAMTRLTNAKLTQETFSSVMSNLVCNTKSKERLKNLTVPLDAKYPAGITNLLSAFAAIEETE